MPEEEQKIEKADGSTVSLKFQPPLPCTTEGCEYLASVGTAFYDARENGWMIFPLCIVCTAKLMRKYEKD